MINLEQLFEQWVLATEEDVTKDTIKIGLEHSWLVHDAKKLLESDPSGLSTILKMRQAFRAFIHDHYITIEGLLNGEWTSKEESFRTLQNMLYSGEVGDTYNNFVSLVSRFSKQLGKEITSSEINKIEKIESIFVDAMKDFKNQYKLHHEHFTTGCPKKTDQVRASRKLHRFETYFDFVQSLRQTSDDNFICLALIDRTYKRNDSEYDNKYDTFFAFGVKNNGVVTVISDRTIFRSPETYYKTRNPGRDFNNKCDYSWLPYYKMNEVKETVTTNNMLLLTDGKETTKPDDIVSVFDTEGIAYISLVFTLIYQQYFQEIEEVPVQNKLWFSNEVQYLPANTDSTALVPSENSIQIISPDLNVTADSWKSEDRIYNTGLYDFYLDLYPMEESQEVDLAVDHIGTEESFKAMAWWRMRKNQYNHVKESLEKDSGKRHQKVYQWLHDQFNQNAEDIIKFMFNNPVQTVSEKNNLHVRFNDDDSRIPFWKDFKDGNFIDTFDLTHYHYKSPERFNGYGYRNSCKHVNIDGHSLNIYGGYVVPRFDCWFTDDNDQRCVAIHLTLRSHSDIEKFFHLENKDLPVELRRYFYDRSGYCTRYGWEPYDGNCILDFTDPMNDIRSPYSDINVNVNIYMSKSKYNKLAKEYNFDISKLVKEKTDDD